MLKHQSEVSSQIQSFVLIVKNQFDKGVQVMCSDHGPEFKLQDFYASKGILHQTACVQTPQQNG